jgi:hypothetical protein
MQAIAGAHFVLRNLDDLQIIIAAFLQGSIISFPGSQVNQAPVHVRIARPRASAQERLGYSPYCPLDIYLDLSQEGQFRQDEAIDTGNPDVSMRRWLCRFDLESKDP